MALDFDARLSEADIRNAVEGAKSAINNCKNQLASTLAFAATVTAEEMDRLSLTNNQKAQAQEYKTKVQAVYDAIIAEGF